jgi:hypothetical protein
VQHRAICLQKIPFARKQSTIVLMDRLRNRYIRQVDSMIEEVRDAEREVNNTLLTLPRVEPNSLPQDFSPIYSKFNQNQAEKIKSVSFSLGLVSMWFNTVSEVTDYFELLLEHTESMQMVKRLLNTMTDPIFRPLRMLNEGYGFDSGANSEVKLYTTREMDRVVLSLLPMHNEASDVSTTTTPRTTGLPANDWSVWDETSQGTRVTRAPIRTTSILPEKEDIWDLYGDFLTDRLRIG